MIVWEPEWRTTGIPKLGDYVQLQLMHRDTGVFDIQEGVFGGLYSYMLTTYVVVIPELSGGPWNVCKWRRGALPEFTAMDREVDTDA